MIKQFILNRFREPSTWRGLIAMAMAAGLHLKPEMRDAIIMFGLALMGGVGVVTPDKIKTTPTDVPDRT